MRAIALALCLLASAGPALAGVPAYAPIVPAPKFDPATVDMPDLRFTPTAGDQAGFDKYFYFHRDGTDFATAYADIQECDWYARGSSTPLGGDAVTQAMQNQMVMQYGMAGAVGGMIGAAVTDAIFGSAERRKMRRTNISNCMRFKEYARYGLPKDLWFKFNFEEGLAPPKPEDRERMIRMQAKVASGPKPLVGEISE